MYRVFFKRLLDIITVLIALPFLMLILVVFGVLIYIEDKGSIFYIAPRLGKNGKVYKMYKLRSMKMNAPDIRNADGSTFNSESDSRLTKIGLFMRKTSIDETPQILNVLKGEMSVIGPRPDLPEHINVYNEREAIKISVRPGITGYNQAYFRNSLDYKLRWENDVVYAQNISFLFDFKILLKTILTVLRMEGLYANHKTIKPTSPVHTKEGK